MLEAAGIPMELSRYFMEKADVRLVLLYGSAAKRRFTAKSDIDIAVAGSQAIARERLYDISAELSALFGRNIDLIDLHQVEGLILHRVMTEGVRIKTDPALFVKFQGKAFGYYEDFKPLQDMIRAERIRRFIDGPRHRQRET
jgi:predicted nucleotidyltransferase